MTLRYSHDDRCAYCGHIGTPEEPLYDADGVTLCEPCYVAQD